MISLKCLTGDLIFDVRFKSKFGSVPPKIKATKIREKKSAWYGVQYGKEQRREKDLRVNRGGWFWRKENYLVGPKNNFLQRIRMRIKGVELGCSSEFG